MRKDPKESAIRGTVSLPRVKLVRGKVGHVVVSSASIFYMNLVPGEFTGTFRNYGDTACHEAEGGVNVRFATPDTPTCRSCLRVLKINIDLEEIDNG